MFTGNYMEAIPFGCCSSKTVLDRTYDDFFKGGNHIGEFLFGNMRNNASQAQLLLFCHFNTNKNTDSFTLGRVTE